MVVILTIFLVVNCKKIQVWSEFHPFVADHQLSPRHPPQSSSQGRDTIFLWWLDRVLSPIITRMMPPKQNKEENLQSIKFWNPNTFFVKTIAHVISTSSWDATTCLVVLFWLHNLLNPPRCYYYCCCYYCYCLPRLSLNLAFKLRNQQSFWHYLARGRRRWDVVDRCCSGGELLFDGIEFSPILEFWNVESPNHPNSKRCVCWTNQIPTGIVAVVDTVLQLNTIRSMQLLY